MVTLGWSGAWAELRAVDTGELAVLPDGVEHGAAATLPVAGVTALRALRRTGPALGRRVLITGASGGVRRFAVQLAARAGAHVIAAVGRPERGAGLAELGAFFVGPGFGPDLAYLAGLLATGALDAQVGWRGGWDPADEAAEALLTRQVAGKAVPDVGRAHRTQRVGAARPRREVCRTPSSLDLGCGAGPDGY